MRISDWSSDVCSSDLATFDPAGLYRLRAVLDLLERLGLDAAGIHAHARALQDRFLAGLRARPGGALRAERLLVDPARLACGNFLTFDLGSEAAAGALHGRLRAADIVTDFRAACLRVRSEEHTSELQSLMRTSSAVFCLK